MKRFLLLLLSVLLISGMSVSACATEVSDTVEIYTVEDLMKIVENPGGSYILMKDLDMTGVEWNCPDFRGSFDGNGHAILNLYLSQPGPSIRESYDGNCIPYETQYAGLFGVVENAEIKNLNLVNVRALVEIDTPCFLAGIAGYLQESTISGCSVSGTLELRAHDRMFGIGGIAGFGGIGLIENCNVDVTLICTDTDAETKDEQFLGGVYGTGFVDVKDCTVTIDGYASEHGYAHNGGIVGMFMQRPFGWQVMGKITGNYVEGKITFFEDNLDRRAYCHPIIGETLAYSIANSGNRYDFKNDERKEYDVELRPEMCENPVYTETVTAPGCDTFGFTTFACDSCGYAYTDDFTLYQHTVSNWEEAEPATLEAEGLSQGNCDLCGIQQQRSEPKLKPEVTPETEPPTQPETTEPPQRSPEKAGIPVVPIAAGAVVLVILAAFLLRPKKKGKFQK